jgi:hypothetical protein
MSLSQSSSDVSRPARRNLGLIEVGIVLLAVSCLVLMGMSAVAKVQEKADRLH